MNTDEHRFSIELNGGVQPGGLADGSRWSFRANGERPPERRRMVQHPGEGCQTRTPGRRPPNPRRPPATVWQPSGLAAPERPSSTAVHKGDSVTLDRTGHGPLIANPCASSPWAYCRNHGDACTKLRPAPVPARVAPVRQDGLVRQTDSTVWTAICPRQLRE